MTHTHTHLTAVLLVDQGGRLEVPHSEPSSDEDDEEDIGVASQGVQATPETVVDESDSSTPAKAPGK